MQKTKINSYLILKNEAKRTRSFLVTVKSFYYASKNQSDQFHKKKINFCIFLILNRKNSIAYNYFL